MALRVAQGAYTLSAGTGNQTVTGVSDSSGSFTGKLLILGMSGASSTFMSMNIGFATETTKQWAIACASNDAQTASTSDRAWEADAIHCATTAGGAIGRRIEFVSFASGEFTINVVTASGTPVIRWIVLGGDDLNVDVGTFTMTTGTGNLTVTGIDEGGSAFTPTAVLFGNTIGNTTEGATTSAAFYLGGMTASDQFAIGAFDTHAADPTNTERRMVTTECAQRNFTGSVGTAAAFSSFASGEFTINKTTGPAANQSWGYVAFGGTAQVNMQAFTQNTSTGSQSVTGVGFQPSVNLFFGVGAASSTSIQDGFGMMFGAASSSSAEFSAFANAEDNVGTTNTSAYRSDASCIASTAYGATTVNAEADFTSNDSDGFTINNSTADATARHIAVFSIGAAAAAAAAGWGALMAGMRHQLVIA